ncbi:MAG TPA: right-handed parallel beta-helix repeat-containing protein, partial [Sumerlaeia bacterium]|nr:right-handed parallel beta-helix repeat-containing protein [Sumerlaeia bacterium]
MPSLSLILGIAAAAFAPGSAAATVYVNGAVSSSGDGSLWSQAYKTIGEGLCAAAFGESVFVAEGRYCENLAMRWGVAVYGGFAGDGSQNAPAERDLLRHVSLIDGMGGRVVLFNDVGFATLDGFSITGGNAIDGGGVSFFNHGWAPAHAHGGNILAHCRIFGNTAWMGGGISCTISFPLITNCLIAGNVAAAPDPAWSYGGGGVYVHTFSPLILNCTISDNVSYGGWTPTSLHGWGGGIVCDTGSATPKIVNTILTGNTSFAVYEMFDTGDATVSYTLFHANPDGAYRDFVGPEFEDGVEYSDSQIEELEANVAEASFLLSGDPLFIGGPGGSWDAAGGVVYDAASSSTLLTDSSASFPTTWTLATKLINPNLAQELQAMITSNTATVISLAGDFTDRAAAGDAYQVYDYHILSGSPCIDAGLSTSTLFDDLDMRPRPFDGTGEGFDVGAYEYCPFLPLVSFVSTQTLV